MPPIDPAYEAYDRQVQQLIRGRRHPSLLFHRTAGGHRGEFAHGLLENLHAEGFQPVIGLGLSWDHGGRDVGYRTYGGFGGQRQRLRSGASGALRAALAPTQLHMELSVSRSDTRVLADGRSVEVPCVSRLYTDRGAVRVSLHAWQSPLPGEPHDLAGEPLGYAFEMQPPGVNSSSVVAPSLTDRTVGMDEPADANAIRLWVVIGDVDAELQDMDLSRVGRPQLGLIHGEGGGAGNTRGPSIA